MKILSIIILSASLSISACNNKPTKNENVQLSELKTEEFEQMNADTIGIASVYKQQSPEQNKLHTTILKLIGIKKL